MKSQNLIKATLAILFLCCLFDMPYGYFQFIRFAAMIGFAALAYYSYKTSKSWMILWIASAVLINPLLKISLGRELWNVMDVIWIVLIGISFFVKTKDKEDTAH